MNALRDHFGSEWLWRLFLVLQALGFILIIYLDVTSSWDLFSDFLYRGHWVVTHKNWLALLFLAGPYLITKASSWVIEAKERDK